MTDSQVEIFKREQADKLEAAGRPGAWMLLAALALTLVVVTLALT